MTRRELFRVAAAAAWSPWLPALPRAARGAALRLFGGELTAAVLEGAPPGLAAGNPRTLDPFSARTRLERELASALHLPLVGPPLPGRPFGALLDDVAARPGRWTLTLREGLVFADGSPVTAEDATASLQRLPAGIAALLGPATVEPVSARTVVIAGGTAARDLPGLLRACGAPLASRAAGDTLWGPPGCGPFKPAAPGAVHAAPDLALVANTACPAGRAYLDRLLFIPVIEPSALPAALRRGRAGVAATVSTAAEVSGARLATLPQPATVVLAISPRLGPELRAAIAACPDRALLAKVFLQGRVRPASTLLPPELLGPLAPPPAEAPRVGPGRKAKTPLTLLVVHGPADLKDVADRLVWDLADAGVAATVGWRTPDALDGVLADGRWDLLLFEWVPVAGDAGWSMGAELLAPRSPLLAGADVAAVRRDLVGPMLDEPDDARTAAARGLDEALRAGGLLVPVVHPVRLLRVAAGVEGLAPAPDGRVAWADVGLVRGAR